MLVPSGNGLAKPIREQDSQLHHETIKSEKLYDLKHKVHFDG